MEYLKYSEGELSINCFIYKMSLIFNVIMLYISVFDKLLDCFASDMFKRRQHLKGVAFPREHAHSLGSRGTGNSDCWVPTDVGSVHCSSWPDANSHASGDLLEEPAP